MCSADYYLNKNGDLMGDSVFELEVRQVKYGKLVTVIKTKGFSENEKQEIARLLKQKLGAGGTVKNGEIIIQGNHKNKSELIASIIHKVVDNSNIFNQELSL